MATQPQIVITNTAPASDMVLTADSNGLVGTAPIRFGDSSNYAEFDTDGSMVLNGTATVIKDEIHDLIKAAANNPSSHLVFDYTEGTLDFKNTCDLSDWAMMNIQLNHDRMLTSVVEPHIHWFQNENKTPNWLIQYRWQVNGQEKITAWTSKAYVENEFTYSGTTLVQITSFGSLTPPVTSSLSDILQIRILRDVANVSTLFGGADTYTGDAEALSVDAHKICDRLGS